MKFVESSSEYLPSREYIGSSTIPMHQVKHAADSDFTMSFWSELIPGTWVANVYHRIFLQDLVNLIAQRVEQLR